MQLTEQSLNNLYQLIVSKYESLQDPKFDFVSQSIEKRPYQHVVEVLSQIGKVTEDTDENDDVSFGYLIETNTDKYYLRISMVASYAFLLNLSSNQLVIPGEMMSEVDRKILDVLLKNQLSLLDKEDLQIRLPNGNEDFDLSNLYKAIFTNSDFFPWENLRHGSMGGS